MKRGTVRKETAVMKTTIWSISILLSLIIFFFLKVVYEIDTISRLAISILSCAFFIHQWRKSFFLIGERIHKRT